MDREIKNGHKGLRDTVRSMSALACTGRRDPIILALAATLADTRILKTLENTLAFVTDNVRYVLDPPDTELVRTPTRALRDRAGDCDDFSVLIASILGALKIHVRFAVARTAGHEFFNHVFPEASIDDGEKWIPLDGTLPAPRVGKVADNILARTTIQFRCPGGA